MVDLISDSSIAFFVFFVLVLIAMAAAVLFECYLSVIRVLSRSLQRTEVLRCDGKASSR